MLRLRPPECQARRSWLNLLLLNCRRYRLAHPYAGLPRKARACSRTVLCFAPRSLHERVKLAMTPGRPRRADRERQGAIGLPGSEVLLRQHPRAPRVGTWTEVELRRVVGAGQRMASQQRLGALPGPRDFGPAANRAAGPDMQLPEQRQRLWFTARCDNALQPRHRRCQLAASDRQLGDMNIRRHKLR